MGKFKIPKNQILWVTYCNGESIPQYLITSDSQRTKYFLYKINKDNSLEKIRTSQKPYFKEVGHNV